MKLFYKYMVIFFIFSPTSNHLHPLQVENCDSNSRLVEDEDDNGKFRLESVKALKYFYIKKVFFNLKSSTDVDHSRHSVFVLAFTK